MGGCNLFGTEIRSPNGTCVCNPQFSGVMCNECNNGYQGDKCESCSPDYHMNNELCHEGKCDSSGTLERTSNGMRFDCS